jgi:hypothetical protein
MPTDTGFSAGFRDKDEAGLDMDEDPAGKNPTLMGWSMALNTGILPVSGFSPCCLCHNTPHIEENSLE